MTFTSYIKDLKKLDDMETEIYNRRGIPISFENEDTEQLRNIKDLQYHIVRSMAASLGVLTTSFTNPMGENK